MKTTLDLSDALVERAKAVALKRRTTLRALVEQGLQRELETVEGEDLERVLTGLRDLSPGLWKKVEADSYVREQRAGWGG